ncbi:MAG: hypothetical protein JXJ22_16985 [Bacteroidales bacterium]|nr:hypothetical protein [Bacteroidales bacterium]
MFSKNVSTKLAKIFLVIFLATTVIGCTSNRAKKDTKNVELEDFISDDDIFDDIDKAKKIFYSLPSPLETAMLIKSAGADYDHELLNSIDNSSKYTTNRSLALNLGIYTTDLSFASLFDQTQTSINYMNAAREMAVGLDITDAIDDQTIKKLENNLNNRDVVMDIISETFLNSSSYLKENDRQSVAAIVLVGGWIEGLYIATKLVGNASLTNNKLVDRILEQKLSFNIVLRMLEDNRKNEDGSDNVDIVNLMMQLKDLNTAFDNVKVESTQIEVEPDTIRKVTALKSQTKISITPQAFKELQSTVDKLRTDFIQ